MMTLPPLMIPHHHLHHFRSHRHEENRCLIRPNRRGSSGRLGVGSS